MYVYKGISYIYIYTALMGTLGTKYYLCRGAGRWNQETERAALVAVHWVQRLGYAD